jgi:hypothetical protein
LQANRFSECLEHQARPLGSDRHGGDGHVTRST